jgi:sarcosine oxidase
MHASPLPDVVVIGLGAVGSAVLRALAAGGARAVGIDRFSPPHEHGSSHGATRITRLAIGEGHEYVPLVLRSHALWRTLEAETGATLLRTTGLLLLAAAGADAAPFHGRAGFFERTVDAARRFSIAHECLDAGEVARRWPAFAPRDEQAYFEPDGGVLDPEACVRAQLESAVRRGATLRLQERATRLEPMTGGVRVITDRGVLEAWHAVLAAGPWLGALVPAAELQLSVQRQTLHWFASDEPELHAPHRMPPFVWMHGPDGAMFYGFPRIDAHAGVKVATEQPGSVADADAVDRTVHAQESAALFETHVRGRVRGVSPRVVRAAACLYTTRPEGRFLVDRHPASEHVTLISACSGHGFKHSAALGEAVAHELLGREPPVELGPFRRHARIAAMR